MPAVELCIDALFPARLAKAEAAVREARGALYVEMRDDPGVPGALGIRRWTRRWRSGLTQECWEDPRKAVTTYRFVASVEDDQRLLAEIAIHLQT